MFSQSSTMREVFEYPEPSTMRRQENGEGYEPKQQGFIVYKEKNKKDKKDKEKDRVFFQIKVIGQVASFVQKLKSSAILRKPNFQKSELGYIHIDDEEKNLTHAPIKYENKFFLICQIWSYLVFFMILWESSFELVLGKLGDNKILEIIGLSTCIVFGILSINSEIKNEKMALVSEREKIREEYLKKNFILDLFTTIGLLLEISELDKQEQVFYIGRLLLLFLIFRIGDILSRIQKKLAISRELEAIMSIIKLLIKIIIALHILSLVLILLSKIQHMNEIEITWVEKSNFIGIPNYELYIYAWYWSCTIISTVGFGDISPGNAIESAFMSIIQIFSCIIFGFFINYIGSLLNIFGESKAEYKREIRRLNNYLRYLHVSDDLRDEARSHLFNKYKTLELYDKNEEEEICSQLTENIKQSLLHANNFTVINNSKMKSIFSDNLLQKLACKLQKKVYPSEQYIFKAKQNNFSLWILEDGSISEIPAQHLSSKPLSVYDKSNNTAGWFNFFTGQTFKSWGITNSFTISYKLDRKNFLEILKEYKKDFFKFHEIKEYFLEKARKFENKCLGCGKLSHNVINCSRIHYIPKKIGFIIDSKKKKGQLKGENKRKGFVKRRQRKRNWALSDLFREELKKSHKRRNSKLENLLLSSYKNGLSDNIQEELSEPSEQNLKQQSQISLANILISKKGRKLREAIMSRSDVESEKLSSIKSYESSQFLELQKSEKILEIDFALVQEIEKFREEHEWEKVAKKYQKYKNEYYYEESN